MTRSTCQRTTWNTADLIRERVLDIGDGYRAKNDEMGSEGLPFARAGNIDGGFHLDSADILDQRNVPKAGQKISQSGDVVFTSKGTVGRFAFVKDDTPTFVYSPQLCYWRVLKPSVLDPRYLFYWMQSSDFLNQVHRVKGLTDMADYVSLSDQRRMTVCAPPLPVQLEVASILSTYDDLIDNNTRRIEILEQMAKMIYREWFVDFRFPGHGKVAVANRNDLVVPERWERTVVECACVSVDDGDWIETKDQGGDSYRLLQVSNIGLNAFVETGNYRFVSEETFQRLRCREVLPGDILVARMPTPIGRAWLVTPQKWKMITAVDVAILKAKEATSLFLLHFLNSTETLAACSAQASGTTRERITRKQIASLPVLLPPEELRAEFSRTAEPINELMDRLRGVNRKLSQTRNLLLPKLISGEINVEHFEPEPVAESV